MRLTAFFPAFLFAALTGCVSLPHFDPDLACNIPTPNEAAAVKLMKQENTSLTGTNFIPGNRVDLLKNGPATYAAMQSAMQAATISIDMESYGFEGTAAAQFSAILLQKRAEGLQVNLIYDAWGSWNTPGALFDQLRKGGVNVVEYSPFNPASLATLDVNKRDHRKLLVIDGRIAFTGGINISQVYQNPRSRSGQTTDPQLLPWRDTDVEIAGPVVADFETLFMQSWQKQKGPAIAPPPATPATPQGDSMVQAIDGAPKDGRPAIYESLLTAIAAAHQSVHLTTGFFAPPPDLAEALKCAARRGVDVRIIVPSRSTSDSSVTAGRSHYGDLLKAGVHIYERQGAVLHAKTAVIDGVWSVVGSSNLDWRSVVFNNEIDAVVLGPSFGRQMETMFQQDILASKEITLAAWRHRGLFERIDEMRARAIESML